MRRALVVSLLALVPGLVHCGGGERETAPARAAAPPAAPPPPSAADASPPPPPQEDGRLPALAVPARYAVTLDVDPTQPRFHGTATVLVDVAAPTRHLILHGRDLHVTEVTAAAGAKSLAGMASVRMAHGALHADELVLTFPERLPAGRATLRIAYDAPFGDELAGLYRVKEGDRWYAFTQFESTDARRAFPCFDEPGFKVPFDLSITTPKGMIAVTNAPESSHKDVANGTRFDFATTPPLPSYLVAFAVGDFDVRSGGTAPVPMRLISAKGKSPLGGRALEVTEALVTKLGAYFGVSYPYAKLDVVAVPDFAAGAMENPGLITFREELLLQDPARTSAAARQLQALVIAHELAHIWFGDLVTMQWWNDLWLNEGFATWAEAKIVEEWDPSMGAHLEAVASAQHVMDIDALASARAVRQPVTSTSEAGEAFDAITYQKGSAVLAMIEHWIGPDTFQRGVRDYMTAHAWKNAKADDLLSALDHVSKRDVTGMAATFLDRPGVPNVAVSPSCAAPSLKLDLLQTAWHPLGVAAKATGKGPWAIPVCVTEAGAGKEACTDLNAERGRVEAPAARCPSWSYPNAGAAGYYRFSLPEKDLRAIARGHDQLDPASRMGFVSNLWAQVRAGSSSPDVLLDTLPAFDGDTERHVIDEVVDVLYDVDASLVEPASRPAFRAYAAARMGGHARSLGWSPKPNERETSDRAIGRERVLLAMGALAKDPGVLREAEARASSWLRDPASVDPEIAGAALRIASSGASGAPGAARLAALRHSARTARTPLDRILSLRAMGAFDDPELLRQVFDLLLTDEIKMQDLRYILGRDTERDAVLNRPSAAPVFFDWVKGHWDAARAKLPGTQARKLFDVMGSACTTGDHEERKAFFAAREDRVEAAKRPFAVALERSTACVELHAQQAAKVTARFAKGAPRASSSPNR